MKIFNYLLPVFGSLFLLILRLWLDRLGEAKGRENILINRTIAAFTAHHPTSFDRFLDLAIFFIKTYVVRYSAVAFLLWSVTWVIHNGVPLFSDNNIVHNVLFSVAAFIIPSIIIALWDAPLGVILSPLFGLIEMFLYTGYTLSGFIGAIITGIIFAILIFMLLNGPDLSVGSPRWSWWFWYIRRRH